MNPYQQHGYRDRADYLKCMAEDYGVEFSMVESLANLLGPNEDFDGLIVALEDESNRDWDW